VSRPSTKPEPEPGSVGPDSLTERTLIYLAWTCFHLGHLRLEHGQFAIELFDLDLDVAYPRIGLGRTPE
jgi:hypothetical protein